MHQEGALGELEPDRAAGADGGSADPRPDGIDGIDWPARAGGTGRRGPGTNRCGWDNPRPDADVDQFCRSLIDQRPVCPECLPGDVRQRASMHDSSGRQPISSVSPSYSRGYRFCDQHWHEEYFRGPFRVRLLHHMPRSARRLVDLRPAKTNSRCRAPGPLPALVVGPSSLHERHTRFAPCATARPPGMPGGQTNRGPARFSPGAGRTDSPRRRIAEHAIV
jgi:hypothetical protein